MRLLSSSRLAYFLIGLISLSSGRSVALAEQPVDFRNDVAPILESRCLNCHSDNIRKGEFSLASAADLVELGYVVPGDPASSYLIDMISAANEERPAMPKEGDPLSKEQVTTIARWIAGGAEWPDSVTLREPSKADRSWWALQPLSNEPVPPAVDSFPDWGENPIDRFVATQLKEAGLSPNPPADRRTLIRRVTYDLTGLPPTPDEVATFLNDTSPLAYEHLLDRLLASPRYGEHWGRHWLDVIRFGESRGFERNQIIDNLWPLRDYVIRAFNDDRPFDQVIREHLAGDVIGKNDPSIEVASAFLVCGPYDDVGNRDPVQAAQIRANTIDEIISATSSAFLGLTIGCARCHDHKFDPILQSDYYQLYATFAGVHHGEREVATREQFDERNQLRDPLMAQRNELTAARNALEAAILKRAEARIAEHEARWPRPSVSRVLTEETFAPQSAKFVRLVVDGTEQNPDARSGFRIDEFEVWSAEETPRNVALAEAGATAEGASKVARDFDGAYSASLTIDGKFGARWIAAGPELTITLPRPTVINRVTFSSDRPDAAGTNSVAAFVCEYRIFVSHDGESWTEVAHSRDRKPMTSAQRRKRLLEAEIRDSERAELARIDRQLADVNSQIASIPRLPVWWVGTTEAAPGPFHIFLGGSPQRPGEPVKPASPSFLDDVAKPYDLDAGSKEAERRLALADWIVEESNPLTPRVLVNRLWHYHFGQGIVATPSDFGYMGGRPSHPMLLDWLARELRKNGWRLKPLHKAIMLSQAYRQASTFRPAAAQQDADSRLLWRYPPRRLTAEEIRDTMLMLSGSLKREMGGPGFRLYRYLQDNVATYVPLDEFGPETYRRTVYHQNARSSRVDLVTDFDGPDCVFPTPRRSETTTPLQALTMLNHQFTFDMSKALAERVERETSENSDEQIRRLYQLCYSRDPTETERQACRAVVDDHGLPALCRVLLNTSELISVP